MKITKQQKKQIRALIRDLPAMQHPDLTQKSTRFKEIKTPIGGKKLVQCIVSEPKDVNHNTEAEKAFRIGGMAAVQTYVKVCKEVYQKHLDKQNLPVVEN